MQLCKRKKKRLGNKIRRKHNKILTMLGTRWKEHWLNFLKQQHEKRTISHAPGALSAVTMVHHYLPSAPDVPSAVDAHTCPCFVFATRTDNLVPVQNAIQLINALCAHDIAFESHIYGNGPHGLTTGDPSVDYQNCSSHYCHWVEDSIAWLDDVLGGMDANGLTAPRFGYKINGNREKTLNLDCTMG